ncbi:branched-chain alpha-keto acid dehydrogenase subunit E2 [mine drainage metagenome]|uniref:Branched-chain alpha-keto acid dehydrogenase subunit E2 n=1 Tax=mine drainage metagenome TaxID=410659 RepID=A0A1J5QCU0_9ZZZZ
MSESISFPMMSKDENAEGVLATWFVKTGERVKAHQVIAEVMVDKVSLDVETPIDGIVTLLVEEGSSTRQGTPIARIE